MTPVAHEAFAAFVGIDWAAATHDVCLQTAAATTQAYCQRAHPPAAMDAGGTTLRTRCHGPPVAIGLDRTTGPLVSAWRTDDFLGLCPLQPLRLARERDACTPSRAQDAPTDAALPRARRLTPRDTRRPLRPPRPPRRALAPRVAHRRRVVGAKVRRTHRLTRTRKNSLPPVRHGGQEQDTALCCDFLRRGPTLQAAQRARRATREPFCRAPHVR
jgi:hypothetical protein